jgi:hypothetical protein
MKVDENIDKNATEKKKSMNDKCIHTTAQQTVTRG